MDCQLTQEICDTISAVVDSLFYKVGFWWLIAFLLFAGFLCFIIRELLKHNLENYKSGLEKNKIKNIELWKQQKELMFDFVKLLEEKIFSNCKLGGLDAKKAEIEVFAELNKYYGQLYLVMETDIIKTINRYMQKTVSPVQRFYLYKELRKQLMGIIYEKFTDEDCPFIGGDPAATLYFTENGEQKTTNNLNEVKTVYPFVEETGGDQYKALPYFSGVEDKKVGNL